MGRTIFSLGILLLWSTTAIAKDYYVAKTGADNNPGTLEQPFLTIQRAANVMVAGDTAFIRAGVYREIVRPANSGLPGSPISFQPYNGETVTVSGADVIASNSWSVSSTIRLKNLATEAVEIGIATADCSKPRSRIPCEPPYRAI